MRADVGATLPASRTDELILNIRKPEVASPAIRVHLDRVAAFVVGAIDQHAIGTGLPHFSESDFLLAGESGHAP